jgi:hypothetical protein
MKRKNCWEVMKCGREPDGKNEELGVCPAAVQSEYDGMNNGIHGGRFCWNLAGSFCKGVMQGSIARKLKNCQECGFYVLVNKEEGEEFILTIDQAKK